MMLGIKNEPAGGFSTDDERDLQQRVQQLTAHPAHQAHLSVLNEAIAGDGFDRSAAADSLQNSLNGAASYSQESYRMHSDPRLNANYQSYISQHNAVDRALEKLQEEQQVRACPPVAAFNSGYARVRCLFCFLARGRPKRRF